MNWKVQWYEYNENEHPLENETNFYNLKNKPADFEENTTDLAYAWWRSPGGNIHPDRFATFAQTNFEIDPGKYKISVTSDDGLRLRLDGKLLIDHWDIHVPATDEIEIELGGQHQIENEHFEGGGFATLAFRLLPLQ